MSMTLVDMAAEVAKSIGGQGSATTLDLATRAVKASLRDWSAINDWNFMLKDTATGFSVAGCNLTSSTTVDVPSGTTDFDGVNVGVVVTLSGSTGTLAAGTTVSSIVRNSSGSVTSIVLSNTPGGTLPDATTTLVFAGDIPIIAGTSEYNFPADFKSPHAARLLVDRRLLAYIDYREWNKKIVDQSASRAVEAYTIYNPLSALTQNYGTYRLRVFGVPPNSDTVHIQYYRKFDVNATTVDIPDAYVEMLIDYAIWRFVRMKSTEDSRLGVLNEVAQKSLQLAIQADQENAEDEEHRIISQAEAWNGGTPLWTNGSYEPYGY